MESFIGLSFKTIHVIGDSHALAFTGKGIALPSHRIAVNASVAYVRGLTADTLLTRGQINTGLGTYLMRVRLIGGDGVSAVHSNDSKMIVEQYSTGSSFECPLFLFNVGEIFLRKYLGSVYTQIQVDMDVVSSKFREIIVKYLTDIIALRDYFDAVCFVHEICPPTADDVTFARINNFECPAGLRGLLYGTYNRILGEEAAARGLSLVPSYDYMSNRGFLSKEYEFDGVHADPQYAEISMKRAIAAWMMSRTAERTHRYLTWYKALPDAPAPHRPKLTVSEALYPFTDEQLAILRASPGSYEKAVCREPALDWAHLPPWHYPKFNEVIEYSSISVDGLKVLYDVLLKGEINKELRERVGGAFSIVNARAVHSRAHPNKGVGQQGFHRDGCPPGIMRGLIYLTDVDENGGAFGYLPTDDAKEESTVTGRAGALVLFDANAVSHRATPPRTQARVAIDLVLLIQPPSCEPIAHSRVNFTWPIDPYMFSLSDNCYPPPKSGRWFHPELIMQVHTGPVKKLSAEEMALSSYGGGD